MRSDAPIAPEPCVEHQPGQPLFPVSSRPVDLRGYRNPGFQALCREDTGRILAIHGPGYRLLEHGELLDAIEGVIADSRLNLEGRTTTVRVSHHGARMYAETEFPAEQVMVQGDDPVCLRVIVVNSYDGSSAVRLLVGAFRLVCSNGMIIGEKYMDHRFRHTRSLETGRFAAALHEGIGDYREATRLWRAWAGTPLDWHGARALLEDVTEFSEKRRDEILDEFGPSGGIGATTLWDFYNALTHWATHGEIARGNPGNRAAARFQRHQLVRRITERMTTVKPAA